MCNSCTGRDRSSSAATGSDFSFLGLRMNDSLGRVILTGNVIGDLCYLNTPVLRKQKVGCPQVGVYSWKLPHSVKPSHNKAYKWNARWECWELPWNPSIHSPIHPSIIHACIHPPIHPFYMLYIFYTSLLLHPGWWCPAGAQPSCPGVDAGLPP